MGHEPASCSFCGKTRDEVRVLVAGVVAAICDECVGVAAESLAEAGVPTEVERLREALSELNARYEPRSGTRRWLADTLRSWLPDDLLIDIGSADGTGMVRVLVAPDRDGDALDASMVDAIGRAMRPDLPVGLELELVALSRAELLRTVGVRAWVDWQIRRVRGR